MYIFLSAGFLLVPKFSWIRTSCGSTWFHLVLMTPQSWWRSSLPAWLPWCQFNSAAWSSTHWPTSCLSLPSTRSVKLYSQVKFLDFWSMKFYFWFWSSIYLQILKSSLCIWLLHLQKGNEFGDVFDELQYVQTQIMIIKLRVEEPKIVFDPPFREIRDIILRCFSEIIASGEGLTRVGIWHSWWILFFIET